MMRRLPMTMLAGLFLTAAAAAQPVAFDDSSDSQARRIVNVVFADYLAQRVGVQVETAVVDLDGDGTGEVMARFIHTSSCREDMSACRTVVLRHDRGSWRIVLDRVASEVSHAQGRTATPGPLTVDGMQWNWGARRYEPVGASLGEPLAFRRLDAEEASAWAPAFGEGAVRLVAGGHGVTVSASEDPIMEGGETVVLRLDGGAACGEATGCPVRVLKRSEDGESWRTVLSSATKGGVAVADASRAGHRDLVLRTQLGYSVMGWTGSSYSVADRIEAVER